jgi:hypothetical protein
VPTALAALGGGVLQRALGTSPEAARAIRTFGTPPEYNAARASGLMVLKDPFNGPLTPPPPFKIAKIDDLKLKHDEKPRPVKVALSGDGATGAKVSATVGGKLFPADAKVKVDPKTNALELPPLPAVTEDNAKATATVEVTATSAAGKTEKTSFRVSLAELPKVEEEEQPAKATEDISKVILLVAVVQRNDGTAWARVMDNANRTRYEVNVEGAQVKVKKEYILSVERGWRTDLDHEAPAGAMHVSDKFSTTDRLLKVVAVAHDGLIVADLQPSGPPKPAPKEPKAGKGGRPPAQPKQGPGSPLAAIGGNVAVAAPAPKYYRWPTGKSLAALQPLSADEAADVLRRAAASPVLVSTGP